MQMRQSSARQTATSLSSAVHATASTFEMTHRIVCIGIRLNHLIHRFMGWQASAVQCQFAELPCSISNG